LTAARAGADYLGIGTVYATATKENSKHIIGPSGVRDILAALVKDNHQEIGTVCIGGINSSNLQRVLFQCASPSKALDGAALVSAIMAAQDPRAASSRLRDLVQSPAPFSSRNDPAITQAKKLPAVSSELLQLIPDLFAAVPKMKPLCHNITNLVVQNIAANIALAVGGSPIMSSNGQEASDLAKLGGSLVLNMGSVTPESLANSMLAAAAYNAVGGPILYDPVGGGATSARREGVRKMINNCYFSIIKGNESEIQTVLGEKQVVQHGVDSGAASGLTLEDKARLVKKTAAKERCVVLMTGKVDLLSDGRRTYSISNGHPLLGEITGSGCTLGTTIAAFAAVEKKRDEDGKGGDMLLATLAGCLVFEIAGERAGSRREVRGPGTFVPAFVDELYLMREEALRGEPDWIASAKVEAVDI
jgi:thiamine-phosphate diphosphorylase/hydroxyethylthiazole kinase